MRYGLWPGRDWRRNFGRNCSLTFNACPFGITTRRGWRNRCIACRWTLRQSEMWPSTALFRRWGLP